MRDLALLVLRLVVGGYVAAHGLQKTGPYLGGAGLDATGKGFQRMGLRPGRPMAMTAAGLEIGGGLLTVLGILDPLGPVVVGITMLVAAGTAHLGRGAFQTTGGPELALTNFVGVAALAAFGPGALSLDHAIGIDLPSWVGTVAVVVGAASGLVVVLRADRIRRAHARRKAAEEQVRDATA